VALFAPGWFTNLNKMLAMGNYKELANALNYGTRFYGDPNGKYIEDNGFPVNFIKASPQFSGATLYENKGYANYHSFQGQITIRPTHGLYMQSTYTWSKNLGNSGGLSPDPRDLSTGYIVQATDRPHNWVTYGSYDLPFGPNRLVGSGTHGALARVIGGWQLGWITSVQSGGPLALTANCGLYGNCTPDVVNGGIDSNSIAASWPNGAGSGSLFADRYIFTGKPGLPSKDPQCLNPSIVAQDIPGYSNLCTLQAIVDSTNGKIVLQNPLPGKIGTLGYNSFRNEARWNLDMSMSKSVAITESKSFRLRVDISNICNHPVMSGTPTTTGRISVPTSPSMNINGTNPIGQYTYKVGGRTIQAMARFDF
jgi:hypothetical protein